MSKKFIVMFLIFLMGMISGCASSMGSNQKQTSPASENNIASVEDTQAEASAASKNTSKTSTESAQTQEEASIPSKNAEENTPMINREKEPEASPALLPIQVEDLSFERISDQEIQILWSDSYNPYVCNYTLKKKKPNESDWQTVGTQSSDGYADNRTLSLTDVLKTTSPQQYEYRIDITLAANAEKAYEPLDGVPIVASNVLVCIDPGHYGGQNAVDMDGVPYVEGDFTLQLAEELQQILKNTYGISSYATRQSSSITIQGYTDGILDTQHISLRGEYAKGSDLFLSLHTNANLDGANGYETDMQPIEITKPLIIVNTLVQDNSTALHVSNAIGNHLAQSNYEMGLSAFDKFRNVSSAEDMVPWTDGLNDALNTFGTVCYRTGEHGDYYGVLRGAANVGVPGMIIEHGFHTVLEMRELASAGILASNWANADAEGLAEGFGFSCP